MPRDLQLSIELRDLIHQRATSAHSALDLLPEAPVDDVLPHALGEYFIPEIEKLRSHYQEVWRRRIAARRTVAEQLDALYDHTCTIVDVDETIARELRAHDE
ncbi:hypothetical protein N7326_03175 [Corynebacterium sp. ES2794-CONJ1]|uniref:hypothetical protein n=1 Tax=unclassified Corynebacterium TaxID=2624378 RepID=UPI002169C660|nr:MULTISPECIES: hypothetical protein [unclassified Corynebacterium]MCS4489579.1 hypothetical protein [Corynebacterium sp. ES2775-CONJ]MCS4491410.1 hypothetical protein [Corynebacterium sp. ES2715-CONJ3]MCS4531489.1 hypothetical protein [Corynebacterium sp. ES2730-CONJ]MCU9518877.1 hypothetical protein [Corynebacterium sp. ES2794-CONJ1]